MKLTISQANVAKHHPEKFAALPEPYQNDSCLDFFFQDGYLHCCPKTDQVFALGQWTCFFDDDEGMQCWCGAKTGEPVT